MTSWPAVRSCSARAALPATANLLMTAPSSVSTVPPSLSCGCYRLRSQYQRSHIALAFLALASRSSGFVENSSAMSAGIGPMLSSEHLSFRSR